MNNKRTVNDLTQGPLFKQIVLFTIPLMLTGILQTLYNAADMIVLGVFASSTAMGSVGACGSLIAMIINTFFGLSVGASVYVARYIGAKNYEGVSKVVHTSTLFAAICGIVVAIFGFFCAKPLLLLMGTPNEQLIEAVPYMQAYFTGVPASIIYNYLAAILRSSGDTKRPLIFLATSGIINVALNFVLVYFFHLGAIGVGISTSVSQYAALTMIVLHMTHMDGPCKLEFKKIAIDKTTLGNIVRLGLPAGLQGTLFALSNVLIQSTVNSYGPIVVNGNSASANIENFIYIAMNALHHTALTFVGQNLGAGKKERVRPTILYCIGLVSFVGIAMGGIALLFGENLLSIYAHGDAETIAAGLRRMSIIASTYFTCGIMDVLCGFSRGMGKSLTPMIISLLGSCALRILWIYTICPLAPDNIMLLYISYPVSWIITSCAHLVTCILTYNHLGKQRKPRIFRKKSRA